MVACTCGIRLDDGRDEAGTLVGESRCPGWPAVGGPLTNNRFPYLLATSAPNYFSGRSDTARMRRLASSPCPRAAA